MLLKVPNFLNADEVRALHGLASEGDFIDGRKTAGAAGQNIKRNEQLNFTREQLAQVNQTMRRAIERSRAVQFFAWPRRVNTPLISRYTPGMEYGSHIDNPILTSRDGEPLRSDISMTVFLSPPEDYDGGELSLDTPFGPQVLKLPAGDALIYSTTLYHRVLPVTRGTRLAAVTWIQSLIKEPERRQILFDLAQARQGLQDNSPDTARHLQIGFSNLIKLWSEV